VGREERRQRRLGAIGSDILTTEDNVIFSFSSLARATCTVALGSLACVATACSSGDDSAQTGGGAGTTGTGSGGSPSSGGGSATATDGASGTTGTGGAGIPDATVSGDTVLFDFNTGVQGLAFNTFNIVDGGDSVDIDDAGVELNLSNLSPFSVDPDVGNPEAGSIKVTIPFSAYNQFADFIIAPPNPPLDLSHKQLFIKYRLDSGFSPSASAPGGVIFYVQSAGFHYAQLAFANVIPLTGTDPGPWTELKFNLDTPDISYIMPPPDPPVPPGYDPTAIIQIGIKFHTGGGVNATMPPTPAVFHIDTIGYRTPPAF
jgi:hypothetical protein